MLRFLAINHAMLRDDIGAVELLHIIRAVDQSEMDKNRLEVWLRENVVRTENQKPRTKN
jgi:hypothetical protein